MKYAVTDYDGYEYITAGKRYEVIDENDVYFYIKDNSNHKVGFGLIGSPIFNWRIEMNNDIEQQGNDFEVKYDDPEEIFVKDGEIFNASKHGFKEYATRYIRADLISQKQPEMRDVTRLDIELRDWYAKEAFKIVIAESLTEIELDQMVNYVNKIADAMMDARDK